jgi:hypothetical protein
VADNKTAWSENNVLMLPSTCSFGVLSSRFRYSGDKRLIGEGAARVGPAQDNHLLRGLASGLHAVAKIEVLLLRPRQINFTARI